MAEKTRVSVDFPKEGHICLKMLCAQKGISLRKYIVDTVLKSMQEEVDDDTFEEAAKKLMKEKNALWKRLADENK